MGWILSLVFIILHCKFDQPEMMIAAGLFGIAGSISTLAYNKKDNK